MSQTLADLGELGLLAELERRGLAKGIADDAALLDGGLVVTQDALVEGVHFTFDRISWRDLGFRAAAVNLSDLAASGADARRPAREPRRSRGHRRRLGARALRRDRRGRRRRRRRRHDGGGLRLPVGHGPRPLGARSGPSRRRSRGRPRRHRPARRRRRGLPPRRARAAADPARRRSRAGGARARADRHLRRDRARRGPHRGALGLPPRHRPRRVSRWRTARRSTTSASARTTSCWRRS